MRLIDADDLNFYCHYDGDCMADKNKCKCCNDYVISFAEVQEQPTAYDIDKVVEELENECISPNDYPGYVVDLEKAIEIVKQGLKEQKLD